MTCDCKRRESAPRFVADRVRVVRDLLKWLDDRGFDAYQGLGDDVDAAAKLLELPTLAVELMVRSDVTFEKIDKLDDWMRENGVSRQDLTGSDEEEG